MKHWAETKEGRGYNYTGEMSLLLDGGMRRILLVEKTLNGFELTEQCDGYFGHEYKKEELLEAIEELKNWVEKQ